MWIPGSHPQTLSISRSEMGPGMFIFIIIPSPPSNTDALWEPHHWKHSNSFEVRELSYHFVYVPKGQAWPTVHRLSVLILVNHIHISIDKG